MARNSMAASIRLAIESDIATGRLLPGQLIDERTLAERFSVSRTPVRQALQQLHGQGVVEVIPRIGARVPRLSIKGLLLLYEVLAELEAAAARLAARRLSAAEARQLEEKRDQGLRMAADGDAVAYTGANRELHQVVYQAARNPLLAEEILRLRTREGAYRLSRFDRPGGMAKSAGEHAHIVAAILSGEAQRAAELMRDHILGGAEELSDFIARLPEEQAPAPRQPAEE